MGVVLWLSKARPHHWKRRRALVREKYWLGCRWLSAKARSTKSLPWRHGTSSFYRKWKGARYTQLNSLLNHSYGSITEHLGRGWTPLCLLNFSRGVFLILFFFCARLEWGYATHWQLSSALLEFFPWELRGTPVHQDSMDLLEDNVQRNSNGVDMALNKPRARVSQYIYMHDIVCLTQ